ncbi:MAG TPA: glycosyltransferase [Longimicrobiales bacterium]|nr:glycosyltransferase [Longimicrobiales bacterium]
MSSPEGPRVLHVLGSLNRGGVETWLLHLLRNAPPGVWRPEFLLHRTTPGAYDAEMRARGALLHYCPHPHRLVHYTRELRKLLRRHGPYDVVHSHVHLFSGVVLRVAHEEGVPVRIAQSHSAVTQTSVHRRAYAALMRKLIGRHATHGLAAAPPAAAVLFGADWETLAHVRLHQYGLDYSAFGELPDRALLKRRIGVPDQRTVIGHVGRFYAVKNHAFTVATFAELIQSGMDAHLLLVGSGPLEQKIREQVAALGITARCTFAGAHNDVTQFFGAMDLFLFPSIHEGLGLAALEAQAAALPVLASTGVPADTAVITELVHRRPLQDGAAAWAAAIRDILVTTPRLARATAAAMLNDSGYSVRASLHELACIYHSSRHAPTRLEAVP